MAMSITEQGSSERLVVLVGAGLSRAAGLPLFDELRDALFHDVLAWRWMRRRTREQLRSAIKLLAPEYAVSLLNRQGEGPREYICQRLSEGHPTSEHHLVAGAAASGAHVYTPNFDDLIERAANHSLDVAVRRGPHDPVPPAQLYKLHGTCPGIVVTAEEVLLSISGPWADTFLSDCATGPTHLLVWGYRGVDPDLAPLVAQGSSLAARCTWIAFTAEDEALASRILEGARNARVEFVAGDPIRARDVARSTLDPDARSDLEVAQPSGPSDSPPYKIRQASTRASALAHVGPVRLGRRAWLAVALRGDRAAMQRVARSLLFDSSVVQFAAMRLLPPLLARRPAAGAVRALLTAAEGHGVRDATDRVIDRVQSLAGPGWEALVDLEISGRVATLLRLRGRLAEASAVLAAVDERLREAPNARDATWTGRMTYEGCIVCRLRGDITGARSILDRVDTSNVAIVGANWSMWLEDERCAIAILDEDPGPAQQHFERADALAKAYGQHRLARADLAIRELQLMVLLNADVGEVLRRARVYNRQICRAGVLTPMRRASIHGVVADAARRAGDLPLANDRHRRLLRSPHLVHRLMAAIALLTQGQQAPIDVTAVDRQVGSTVWSDLVRVLTDPREPHDDLATRIAHGRHFLFVS